MKAAVDPPGPGRNSMGTLDWLQEPGNENNRRGFASIREHKQSPVQI